jgi:hypothetical protein
MAIGRDAMTREVSDRRKRVLKIKDLMGSPAAKGRMSPMKMPASAPMAAPDMASMSSPEAGPPQTAMKKGGRVVEKGSKEVYVSKAAMKKHEAGESKVKERKEDKMRGGGIAQKGKGIALKKGGLPNIGTVKGVTKNKPKLVVMIAMGKGKKK